MGGGLTALALALPPLTRSSSSLVGRGGAFSTSPHDLTPACQIPTFPASAKSGVASRSCAWSGVASR